ncbi:MAG: LysR family transcriptional regulator [Patulibacter minatonensis]
MDLQQLRYLDALASEGHFGRAAAACHVSQPALSTAIRRLETEVGLRLVRRGQRFEGLTGEGERLLAWARATLAAADGLQAEAAALRGTLGGTARIGAIPTVATSLGRLLAPFLAAHPAVTVGCETGPADAILRGVQRHELDAGLVYVDDPLPAGLRASELYREELVLVTSHPSGAAVDGPIGWDELGGLDLCLLAPAMQNRQFVDRALEAAGVSVRARVEADSVAALVDLGLHGSSCIVARAWLDGRALPPSVHVRPLVRPVVAPAVGLVTLAGPVVSPRARALLASFVDDRRA